MPTTRTRTRRLAALTAIGALALVGVAGSPAAHAAPKTLTYDCTALSGSTDAGKWTVVVDATLPESVKVGSTMPAPAITAKVTTSEDAAGLLRLLTAESISGTGKVAYSIDTLKQSGSLTVPSTDIPASGPISVTASGKGQAAKAPGAPTTSTVKAGDFTADLTIKKKDGTSQAIDVKCTLPSGTDATLGTIKVVADDAEPTTTSSSSSATSTTSTSAAPTSSDEPTGPPVETGLTSDGANGQTIALGALALGGVVAAGLATRRRLND